MKPLTRIIGAVCSLNGGILLGGLLASFGPWGVIGGAAVLILGCGLFGYFVKPEATEE